MDLLKSQKYIAAHRDETIKTLCRFLLTDTLLFWSDNPDLYAHQQKHWQPVLDTLNTVFKINLQTTTHLIPAANENVIPEFERHINAMSDKELTGCFLAAAEMKSVLLGLLLATRKITAVEAFEKAYLEELYQNQFWGEDAAALQARETAKNNLLQIEDYLKN